MRSKKRHDEGVTVLVKVTLTPWHIEKLEKLSKEKETSINRLIGILVDNELCKDEPFKSESKDEDYVEYAYIDEAGKILSFLKKTGPLSFEFIYLCRHLIGIHDGHTFCMAFRECLKKDFLEENLKLSRGKRTPYKTYGVRGKRVVDNVNNKVIN